MTPLFARTFAWSALILCTGTSLISAFLVAAALRTPASVTPPHGIEGFPAWLTSNLTLVASAFLLAALVGVLASIGILRRRRWAFWTWVVLLSVAIAWAVVGAAFELLDGVSSVLRGGRPVVAFTSLMTAGMALIGSFLLAGTLRRLLSILKASR